MTTRMHQLNYKIHTLNSDAFNYTPARQVYKTVSGILRLVMVRLFVLYCSVALDLTVGMSGHDD